MRKFLLPLLLCLAGCQATVNYPVQIEPPPPTIVARGTDGINEWACSLGELNHSLVWVECKFTNTWPKIAKNSTATSCIRVRFYDEATGKVVAESRKVCSSPLKTGENFTNYAAFIKKDRDALRRCGELLDLCVMLAGNENP